MRSPVVLCLFVLCCLVPTRPALAADYDLSLSTGYLGGDSTYQVGGRIDDVALGSYSVHFPLSELKFPLDAFMLKAEVEARFADKWRLTASGQTNITEDTGKMEDSDWLSPGRLDIFSQSETDMRALLFDAKLSYRFFQGHYGASKQFKANKTAKALISYSAALGYKHQDFDFDVSNLDQWYPSVPSLPHDRVSGLVLTYDVEYWIPYLELEMEVNKADKFFFEFGLAYAPMVNVKDEDHHLLRDLVAISDHDWNGSAKFLTVKGRYNLDKNWFVGGDLTWMNIESDGRSVTYIDGVYDHTIDNSIESDQLSVFLTLGYSF